MPRARVDGLLASFPKLIPANSQHTTVETADVRFVYQPFEELYVLLITNKGSNILQVGATTTTFQGIRQAPDILIIGHCDPLSPRSVNLFPHTGNVGACDSPPQL